MRPLRFATFISTIFFGLLLVMPGVGYAQEATIAGTITDSTGGVLPGVSVTATHTASGNTFTAVTDERGGYRLPVRIGGYTLIAELSGFGTAMQAVTVLVGQQATVDLQMVPSGVQESVTVTGTAPLLNMRDSTLGANIDSRQMQELPVQGRNWQSLVLLAPGARQNSVDENQPVDRPLRHFAYQLNVDGQQVTQIISNAQGNPRFSRDAIAEFQYVANRFDAAQGRSSGVQVNAITKSGTNALAGSLSGYFRDDRFNAADHVAGRVLPYSNTQISTTLGGPIRRDRMHFFGYYEYEREPQTLIHATAYPSFNVDVRATRREHLSGGRFDTQFSSSTRLSVVTNVNAYRNPTGYGVYAGLGGATVTPSAPIGIDRDGARVFATLPTVLSNRALNEVKGGWTRFAWKETPMARTGSVPGTPRVLLRGITIGQTNQFSPQDFSQDLYSVRDDLTYSFTRGGRHDVKAGGELLYYDVKALFCNICSGQLEANIAPPPANLEALFPNMQDASTWNLAALSPISILYRVGIGNFDVPVSRSAVAGWVQDDWAVTSRVTLNLGVRYDLQLDAFGHQAVGPFLAAPDDTNNIAPRVGFTAQLNDRTVIRGGIGTFFSEISTQFWRPLYNQSVLLEVLNDGRPDFASNPFNGPVPTYEQGLARLCPAEDPLRPGCIRPSYGLITPEDGEIPYSYQGSIGVQRQLGTTMAVVADYVYNRNEKEQQQARNVNLSYNPATGVNYPFTDVARRPYPHLGAVQLRSNIQRSEVHALETSFTKRFSNRWQAAATYALSGFWDEIPPPEVGFPLAPDMGAERGLAATDQRHRATFNGIWDVGRGLQVSGLYFFGSGQRQDTRWGPDLRIQGAGGASRLRPNGTLVPRNNFVGESIHKVDVRLQQEVPLPGGVALQGMLEVFNLFNHANFGTYTTLESNPSYGRPSPNANVAYAPRTLQLGFRVTF